MVALSLAMCEFFLHAKDENMTLTVQFVEISADKPKVMSILSRGNHLRIIVGTQELEYIDEFRHFGASLVTKDVCLPHQKN